MTEGTGKIDLHCHTKASDNTMTVNEVLSAAVAAGISHLAITDHDTTLGVQEAMELGERVGITIIPGIEISAYDYERGRRAHILGYYIQPGHPALARLCGPIVEQRHQASFRMVQRLVEAGYRLSWEQVLGYAQGGSCVYKQHIMHALVDSGQSPELFGVLYKQLFSRSDEQERTGSALVPLKYVDAVEAIRAIRDAGGVAVLAHPGQLHNYEAIEGWAAAGLEGIEALHPSHNRAEEQKARWYAEQYGLVATGGSDFHGGYGNAAYPLGCIDAGTECLHALEERRLSRREAR
ncbi:PHP domain-containing protein [Paenibacillus koleovorans]|uniref:PHP domain-containing protein n=1 Tax=Paenibacillus koleovorans TaxID=121608 RepID=UPI000FD9D4B4|nr:PHP domain-containing protein [Paenibacillus koleovorans]